MNLIKKPDQAWWSINLTLSFLSVKLLWCPKSIRKNAEVFSVYRKKALLVWLHQLLFPPVCFCCIYFPIVSLMFQLVLTLGMYNLACSVRNTILSDSCNGMDSSSIQNRSISPSLVIPIYFVCICVCVCIYLYSQNFFRFLDS